MVAAAVAVAVSSICIGGVRISLLWLSIICFVLFMKQIIDNDNKRILTAPILAGCMVD